MSKRIFGAIFAVSMAAVLLLGALAAALVYTTASRETWNLLATRAFYIASGLETSGEAYLDKIHDYSGRTTLIAPDGHVLYDDKEDPAAMGNHADRPEVRQALQNGTGRDERRSATMDERTLYYALRLPGGEVLRVSTGTASVWGQVRAMLPWMLCALVLVALASGLVARRQSKAILAPLAQVDLDHPLDSDAYGEFSPFLRRIAAQQEALGGASAELHRRGEEFATVTQNISDGLVLVNRDGAVLSINPSAKRILGVSVPEPTGQPLLALNRNLELDAAVKGAVSGEKVEELITLGGRQYRLTARPAKSGGELHGALLLLADDTEALEAERRRKEFSANVSHELKTPLTSISGYAEIIRDGIAKPEDVKEFSSRIYDDSRRLIALVDDIIKLSHLDEKSTGLPAEPVDLLALAENVAESLSGRAIEKQIAVSVSGEPVTVTGVRSILDEVVYNLLDNALRYTPTGGSAAIRVARQGGEAVVQVQDDGIGIPPEHQPYVFERFYRVDQSHSRGSGGTGLGLAIVKRGVLYHGGSIALDSAPGKGSTFTITLPLEEP